MTVNSTPDMQQFVRQQTDAMRSLWYASADNAASLPAHVNLERKIANEAAVSSLLEWAGNYLESGFLKESQRREFSSEAVDRFKITLRQVFDLEKEEVECIESLGVVDSAKEFYLRAHEFDPFMSFEEIYQASRNVWTSNYLQALMGLPVQLTPALFAYSMLYPVSDNYLDDPYRSRQEKAAYNARFRSWLEGDRVKPQNSNERDVLDLVGMIEEQYPRWQFPQVYQSLLAIHSAQDKSMRIAPMPLRPNTADIVGLTFEKGGTSVLADGVLAAGQLTLEQMQIIFNYGAFAQLMDDQEDIENDLRDKVPTFYSEAAVIGKVDQVLNKVFNFAHEVLIGLDYFDNPAAKPLKRISMKGIDYLLIDEAMKHQKYYSKSYLLELERHFPFRFGYLQQVRRNLKKKRMTAERLTRLLLPEQGVSLPVENQRILITDQKFTSAPKLASLIQGRP